MELSDRELVQQCQSGDVDAFQELVSRYHQKVYQVILGMLRNPEDAMEVSQETFFRAFRKIKSFQGGSSFYTWIYRIAVNIATVPDFGRDVKFQTGNLKEKFLLMIFTSCTSDGGV